MNVMQGIKEAYEDESDEYQYENQDEYVDDFIGEEEEDEEQELEQMQINEQEITAEQDQTDFLSKSQFDAMLNNRMAQTRMQQDYMNDSGEPDVEAAKMNYYQTLEKLGMVSLPQPVYHTYQQEESLQYAEPQMMAVPEQRGMRQFPSPGANRAKKRLGIPPQHPVSVYTDPKFNYKKDRLLSSPGLPPRKAAKPSNKGVSDLRNPFKAWKPSKLSRQTNKAIKEVTQTAMQQQMGMPVQAPPRQLTKPSSLSALRKQDPKLKKELLLNELQAGRKDIMSNRILLHDINQHISMLYKQISKIQTKKQKQTVFTSSASIENLARQQANMHRQQTGGNSVRLQRAQFGEESQTMRNTYEEIEKIDQKAHLAIQKQKKRLQSAKPQATQQLVGVHQEKQGRDLYGFDKGLLLATAQHSASSSIVSPGGPQHSKEWRQLSQLYTDLQNQLVKKQNKARKLIEGDMSGAPRPPLAQGAGSVQGAPGHLRVLLQKASQLQSKMKNSIITLQDMKLVHDKESHYEQASIGNRNRSTRSHVRFAEGDGTRSSNTVSRPKNVDLESLDKLSTNMFDSRLDLAGGQTPDQAADPATLPQFSNAFYEQSAQLTDEIRTLEQSLIHRTAQVLKNTDMLREFKQFKMEQQVNQPKLNVRKKRLQSAGAPGQKRLGADLNGRFAAGRSATGAANSAYGGSLR